MPATNRLVGVRLKIERAKQHIAHLQAEITSFKESDPYPFTTNRDPQTRELVYNVVSVADTPPAISLIAGDAIQNLRSALDHLALQLFRAGPGGSSDCKHVGFPIVDDPAKNKPTFDRQVRGMRQDAIDAISGTEAFERGNGHQLWVLHKLNITDKHRLLLTVGSAYRSIKVATFNRPGLQNFTVLDGDQGHDLTGITIHPILGWSFDLKNPICPLKPGDELFRDMRDAEVNQNARFGFEVSLAEPQVTNGEPLLQTIHHFANTVDDIANQFERFL